MNQTGLGIGVEGKCRKGEEKREKSKNDFARLRKEKMSGTSGHARKHHQSNSLTGSVNVCAMELGKLYCVRFRTFSFLPSSYAKMTCEPP